MKNLAINKMHNGQTLMTGKNLVVGLGKTGLSVVRFLNAIGESVAINDSRDVPPGHEEMKEQFPDVACFTGGFNQAAFTSAERLIVNPGISVKEPLIAEAIKRGVEVIGDIEVFARFVDKPVIAITGSNGKTTVTTLLGEMAKAAGINAGVGGNIGTPALDLLGKGYELYILELSSFQLETLYSLKPLASVVLNVSEDHMDRYDSLREYADAKAVIYQNADHAVINGDDAVVALMKTKDKKVSFQMQKPNNENQFGITEVDGLQWLAMGDQCLLPVNDLLIAGKHNQANALAALALGHAAGFDMQRMLEALKTFKGLPHRTQFIAEINQVRFYNDSKATNVGACIAALNGFDNSVNKTVIIMGGDCKQADFSEITEVIRRACRAVILIGKDKKDIENCLPVDIKRIEAVSLSQAVSLGLSHAEPGDRVLLSPACASFDMFSGYEDRGNQFIKAVRELVS